MTPTGEPAVKKYLCLGVVFVITTGLSVGFRHGVSGTSKASRQERSGERLARLGPADRTQGPIEGASLTMVPAGTGSTDEKTDREFARGAASTGDRLMDRAKQSPDNPHLLRQAAAHYRAALTHEPTVRDAGDLFSTVRVKLTRLDREINLLNRPGVTKPALQTIVKAPVVKPITPAPVVIPPVAAKAEGIMVGPDGVEIRRVGPPE